MTLTETEDDYARLNYKTANGSFYWTLAGLTQPLVEDDRFNVYNSRGGNILMMKGDGRVGVGADPKTPFQVGGARRVLFGNDTINGGEKLMFLPDKNGAFRAGRVSNIQWNGANIGNYSTAFGNSNIASGDFSFASGNLSEASGLASFAFGDHADASGNFSVAFGEDTESAGSRSSAFGYTTFANGNFSSTFGLFTRADSYASTVLGRYNVISGNLADWIDTDPLFVIGNGASSVARSNALTVLKDGTIIAPSFDLGEITDPKALTTKEYVDANLGGSFSTILNVTTNSQGSYPNDDFVFGSPQLDDSGNIDHDNRMFFDKSKGAFRAGSGIGANWNESLIGMSSLAGGESTEASGDFSVAFGDTTRAIGEKSMAIGDASRADGLASIASGIATYATGNAATAMGGFTAATGWYSTALGTRTNSETFAGLALGRYNVGLGNETIWIDTDPVFEIGIGTGLIDRENAVTVLKNGKTGIGSHTPASLLEVSHKNGAPTPSDQTNALSIVNSSINSSWQFHNNSDSYLHLYFDGNYRGTFNPVNGAYGGISDRRLKRNIQPLADNTLEMLMQLNPVHYQMKDQSDSKLNRGLIAQEVAEIFPDMVYKNEEHDLLSMTYSELIPVLIKATQEQQQIINELKARIETLELPSKE